MLKQPRKNFLESVREVLKSKGRDVIQREQQGGGANVDARALDAPWVGVRASRVHSVDVATTVKSFLNFSDGLLGF